ncbi:MAG: hypothetical protein WDN69_15155 [Aliidongia sp.]
MNAILRGNTAGTVVAVLLAILSWQLPSRAVAAPNPEFAVDASWPLPLPSTIDSAGVAHAWVTGEIAGTCVDQRDHVYTFNRGWETGVTIGGVLQGNESGAIDSNDVAASAIPSPPIVVYDSAGHTVTGWGNPTLNQTGPAYGYPVYLPHGSHGCFIDYQGNLWVGGNGDGIVQEYNPNTAAAAAANGKGASVTFKMQIGQKATCDGPQTTDNPYSSCGETADFNTSHTLLNEPADITVDPQKDPITGRPGSIYIADGYGNHRVVVFDSNGNYLRQWGSTCMLPNASGTLVPTDSESCPPGTFGGTGGGHPHCVVLGNDGLICDRPNSRIQVFEKSCGAPSTPSNPQPMCQPVSVLNINGFDRATNPNANAILLAGTRGDDIDFCPISTTSPARADQPADHRRCRSWQRQYLADQEGDRRGVRCAGRVRHRTLPRAQCRPFRLRSHGRGRFRQQHLCCGDDHRPPDPEIRADQHPAIAASARRRPEPPGRRRRYRKMPAC